MSEALGFIGDPTERILIRQEDGSLIDQQGQPARKRPGDRIVDKADLTDRGAATGQDETSSLTDAAAAASSAGGVDRGDIGLKLLEVLGGLGGGLLKDRAIGRANKETQAGQAKANLLNILSGGRGAQAARVRPKVGVAGRLLETLGGLGKATGELRGQQRSAEQQDFENQLAQIKSEADLNVSEARIAREERLGAGGGARERTPSERDKAAGVLGADVYAEGGTREDVEARVREVMGDDELAVSAGQVAFDAIDRAQDKEAEIRKFRDKKFTFQQKQETRITDNQVRDDLNRLSQQQRGAIKDAAKSASGEVKSRVAVSLAQGAPVIPALDFVSGQLENAALELDQELTASQVQFIVNRMRAGYFEGIGVAFSDKKGQGGLSNQAWMSIADVNAMREKVNNLEGMLEGQNLVGPIFGRIPSIQLIAQREAIFDAYSEAFALELASVLNRGRPSEKDFEAARKIVPLRSDRPAVRAGKLKAIAEMLAEREKSINEAFPPVLTIRGSGEEGFEVVSLGTAPSILTEEEEAEGGKGVLIPRVEIK